MKRSNAEPSAAPFRVCRIPPVATSTASYLVTGHDREGTAIRRPCQWQRLLNTRKPRRLLRLPVDGQESFRPPWPAEPVPENDDSDT